MPSIEAIFPESQLIISFTEAELDAFTSWDPADPSKTWTGTLENVEHPSRDPAKRRDWKITIDPDPPTTPPA